MAGSAYAVVSVGQDGKVEGFEEIVVFSQQRRVSDKLLEIVKQRRLNVIHEQISCVLVVSSFVKATYIITKMEEIARKITL